MECLYVVRMIAVDLFGAAYYLELLSRMFCGCPIDKTYYLACAMHLGIYASIGGHDELSLGPAMSQYEPH